MFWLYRVSPLENMGDCDFKGCPTFTPNPHCFLFSDICLIVF